MYRELFRTVSLSRFARGLVALVVWVGVAAPAAAAPDSLQPVDLALNKPARQSSNPWGAGPQLAVDGNTDGNYGDGSVSHTYIDPHSYWEVDLGQVRQIGRVEIYNRTDCCQDRLIPFMLMVSDNPIADADMTAVDGVLTPGVFRTTVSGPVQTIYYVPVNRSGRYVRIALVNQNYLHLAEVRVLEADSVARGRATSQSSTVAGGDASNAVDANVDSMFADGSVAATTVETNPYWQVDLGAVRAVRQIDVWSSATTCCTTQNPRLPLIVWMSNSPITVDPATTYAPGIAGYWLNPQGNPASVTVDTSFRYLRVEAIGTDSLSLAEVQVWPVATGSDGGHASLSTQAAGVDPNWAIDGHVNSPSAATQSQFQPYLDIDLGAPRYLETVRLWNELTDYNLFVSTTPFVDSTGHPATTYAATSALPGVSKWYSRGAPTSGGSSTTAVMRMGRFVRVMLGGTTTLSLTEAEISTTDGFYTGAFDASTYNFSLDLPSFNLLGYFPRPNTLIYFYAYTPNAGSGGGYTYLGWTTSGSTPYITTHAAAPSYQFTFNNLMIPSNLWPRGGVGGLYVTAWDNGGSIETPLRGVDPDNSFNSFWPDNRYISTYPTPDNDSPQPPYLQYPSGTGKTHPNYLTTGSNPGGPYGTGGPNVDSGGALWGDLDYFQSWSDPLPIVGASFYNVNELGLGRTVHCSQGMMQLNHRTSSVNATQCTIYEYAATDSTGAPQFGNQSGAVAAMENGPLLSASVIVALNAPPYTAWFGSYVDNTWWVGGAWPHYEGATLLTASTPFDSTGHNSVVPNNCLACHGGTSAVAADGAGDVRGYFLPIDPSAVTFVDDPSKFVPYAQQVENIRQINAMILASNNPPAALTDFINGSYHGGASTSGTAFDPTYVPAGWATTSAQMKVYNQVIKPYCRSCHQSQVPANGGINFMKATDAEALRALIVSDVCVTHRMPHAQQPMLRFWGSGARAQLLGYFGRRDFAGQTCTP